MGARRTSAREAITKGKDQAQDVDFRLRQVWFRCHDRALRRVVMSDVVNTHRRGFLGRVLGASAAATLTMFGARQSEAQQPADPDAWIKGVKGTHRTLFDFPQHRGGVPLLHIVNYLSTYQAAYKAPAGSAGAVGTFYSVGVQSSIPLAFNDAMWA